MKCEALAKTEGLYNQGRGEDTERKKNHKNTHVRVFINLFSADKFNKTIPYHGIHEKRSTSLKTESHMS